MGIAKTKGSRSAVMAKKVNLTSNHKRGSFRDLKAFGIWANRIDLMDAVQFTSELRARMEHGKDAR